MGSWQDDLRGALDGLAYGARSALSPSVLQGAAVELGWLTTHLAMYPLGLVGGTQRALPSRLNLAASVPRSAACWSATSAPPVRRSCWRTGSSTTTRSSR